MALKSKARPRTAIYRIDVDNRPGNLTPNGHPSALPSLTNYSIPADNPWVGATTFNGFALNLARVRTEFWAVGMRNPWRWSFDPLTGELYLGHVGQDFIEWIDILRNNSLSPALSSCPILSTNPFDANGNFRFTNGLQPGAPRQFYLLQLP